MAYEWYEFLPNWSELNWWIDCICIEIAGGFGSNKRSSLPHRFNQKPGMRALIDQMERETPRPKSPHMNNEEPIELAHFPNANRSLIKLKK